jgi:hypothetical protein
MFGTNRLRFKIWVLVSESVWLSYRYGLFQAGYPLRAITEHDYGPHVQLWNTRRGKRLTAEVRSDEKLRQVLNKVIEALALSKGRVDRFLPVQTRGPCLRSRLVSPTMSH